LIKKWIENYVNEGKNEGPATLISLSSLLFSSKKEKSLISKKSKYYYHILATKNILMKRKFFRTKERKPIYFNASLLHNKQEITGGNGSRKAI
jgi:hypothetical protein